jgi:hypothetical protein
MTITQVETCKRVEPGDLDQAVELLLRKSKGQLIYAKYAVDYMRLKVWDHDAEQEEKPSAAPAV